MVIVIDDILRSCLGNTVIPMHCNFIAAEVSSTIERDRWSGRAPGTDFEQYTNQRRAIHGLRLIGGVWNGNSKGSHPIAMILHR